LSKVTKKLNVYSGTEKIDSFFDLYQHGIDLDPNSLIQTLNAYRDYLQWCDDHFDVANYFFYEEHLPQIEKYILNLPIFAQQTQRLGWQDNFNMRFDTWNLCRYVNSDLGTLALDQPEKFAQLALESTTVKLGDADVVFLAGYNRVRDPSWPKISTMQEYQNLPEHIRREVEQHHHIQPGASTNIVTHKQLSRPLIELLPDQHQEFIKHNQKNYDRSMNQLWKMIDTGVLVSYPPIKKQTLAEKKHLIKNYQHLLDVYNQWIEQNPNLGHALSNDTLDQFADLERARWNPTSSAVALSDQPTTGQF
jgi:hypothetical protein